MSEPGPDQIIKLIGMGASSTSPSMIVERLALTQAPDPPDSPPRCSLQVIGIMRRSEQRATSIAPPNSPGVIGIAYPALQAFVISKTKL